MNYRREEFNRVVDDYAVDHNPEVEFLGENDRLTGYTIFCNDTRDIALLERSYSSKEYNVIIASHQGKTS